MSVKISQVKMESGKERIKVESPYHPDFPRHAKNLGGRWDSKARAWYFDPRDDASVRDLCRDCFGTDGEEEPDLVDCQVTLTGTQGEAVWFAGREIARRPSRDWDVKLGDNVVVVEGDFQKRGGSRKYPRVSFHGDSITLEVRDVPASLAAREAEEDKNVVILGELAPEPLTVTIDGPALEHLEDLRARLNDMLTDDEIVAAALNVYAMHVCSGGRIAKGYYYG